MSEQTEVEPITDEEIAEHLRNLKNPVYVDDLASNGGIDLYTEARFIARVRADAERIKALEATLTATAQRDYNEKLDLRAEVERLKGEKR